jgi:DNA-binding MarR family transcriptional regulator
MATKSQKKILTPWICRLSRLSTLFVGREMGRIGFGPGHFFFISELYAEEGLSQDELSRRVGVDKSNTSRALAKLEKYGLVYRRANPDNHKEKNVYLQKKAYEIKEEFRKIQHRWNETLLNGFSDEEKATFISSLKKMADNAEAAFREEYSPLSERCVKCAGIGDCNPWN